MHVDDVNIEARGNDLVDKILTFIPIISINEYRKRGLLEHPCLEIYDFERKGLRIHTYYTYTERGVEVFNIGQCVLRGSIQSNCSDIETQLLDIYVPGLGWEREIEVLDNISVKIANWRSA